MIDRYFLNKIQNPAQIFINIYTFKKGEGWHKPYLLFLKMLINIYDHSSFLSLLHNH